MARYANVIVDVAAGDVDRIFDYLIPEDMNIERGMRVKIPFGPRKIEGFVVDISHYTEVPKSKIKPISEALDEVPSLNREALELAFWMKDKYKCLLVEALRVMMPAQMRGGRIKKKVERYAEAVLEADAADDLRGPKQKQVFLFIAGFEGAVGVKEVNEAFTGSSQIIKALEEKGYIEISEVRSFRTPYSSIIRENRDHFKPNFDQDTAIKKIVGDIEQGGISLLHGVTGSGKTEVYMQCADHALKQGKSVIILVPEISLTPQMVRRFTSRFSDLAAVMHSRLSAGERYDEWQRLKSGRAKVAIGARSAIFAPLKDIGLIVIDEEHESTYRSQNSPRYDAVEVAKKRCEYNSAALVLGSATPSVISYYRAKNGEYHLLEMPKRIGTALMPEVEIVDMREEFKKGNPRVISQALYDALDACLERGEQAILFLNRRGHSTFVSCRECGYVCECEFCDLPMTYHKATGKLHCHYCGHAEESPQICPGCGSEAIRFFGGGTQKIQEQIGELFPDAATLRMDADTTTAKESHLTILDKFAKQEAQILIGTQMIAKGLDYPNVTLVGVIAADTSLYMNDVNAAERTFQLVSQVAGRAGRAGLPGKVVVQTYSPEHYAIKAAAGHDYKGFYKREINLREVGLFPPFAKFTRFVITHEDKDSAFSDMRKILTFLRSQLDKNEHLLQAVLMLEGTPAPYHRLRGLYRYQVIIKYYEDIYGDEMEELIGSAKDLPESQSTCVLELDAHDII